MGFSMKLWLSLIAALCFFFAASMSFFIAGTESASGAGGVTLNLGKGVLLIAIGAYLVFRVRTSLPSYWLKRTDQSLRDWSCR
jgi:hypothetical protein